MLTRAARPYTLAQLSLAQLEHAARPRSERRIMGDEQQCRAD
jgi:hypothetical protein